jgi:hypothetical protein
LRLLHEVANSLSQKDAAQNDEAAVPITKLRVSQKAAKNDAAFYPALHLACRKNVVQEKQ